jgi:hypothetical protein
VGRKETRPCHVDQRARDFAGVFLLLMFQHR